jgi:hypothetical protein
MTPPARRFVLAAGEPRLLRVGLLERPVHGSRAGFAFGPFGPPRAGNSDGESSKGGVPWQTQNGPRREDASTRAAR